MLLVKTSLGPSRIHGLGVMVGERVPAGRAIWRFAPGFDLVIPAPEARELAPAFQAYLSLYGYPSPDFPDSLVLSCDHAKFMNHSEAPNTEIRGRETFARCDLAEGDEITCDYRVFVLGWTGFDKPTDGSA